MKPFRVLPLAVILLSVLIPGAMGANPVVSTDSASVIGTGATLFGNITDYGSYSNLTAGFFVDGVRHNDGASSPPAPPYPSFIQGWSMSNQSGSPDIPSATLTVDTTEGGSQVASLTFCQVQAGTAISLSGFTTIVDRSSAEAQMTCAANPLRYYVGVRENGSHATSFMASFTPTNSVTSVSFAVAEYANLGSVGATYTSFQFSATPSITQTIPAKSILLSAMHYSEGVGTITYDTGNKRVEKWATFGSAISIGDEENGNMTDPASVTIQPHFFSAHFVEFDEVVLTFASPPEAFSIAVSGLTACAQHSYRAFVAANAGSAPLSYGSTMTFDVGGVGGTACPFENITDWLLIAIFVVFMVGGSALLAAWRLRD